MRNKQSCNNRKVLLTNQIIKIDGMNDVMKKIDKLSKYIFMGGNSFRVSVW